MGYKIIIFFSIVVTIYTVYLYIKKKIKNKYYYRHIENWTNDLENHIPIFMLIQNKEMFLMSETYEEIYLSLNKFKKLFKVYKIQFKNWKYYSLIPYIEEFITANYLENYNNEFIDSKSNNIEIKELLDNIDGKSLDKNQRETIISDERNTLVIAGAGSGKTLTISGKVIYLTQELNIDPNEILLVTFTNKSSDEMYERINTKLGIDVKVYTFHKLGLEIIAKHKGYKPLIAEDDMLSNLISEFLESDIFNDNVLSQTLLEFFSYYFYTPFDYNEFNNLTDYYDDLKANKLETIKNQLNSFEYIKSIFDQNKTTLKKELVKSYEELAIANFLYLNGIEYEYERPYPKFLADQSHMQYKPDFYLNEYDIYIEHYGIDKNNNVPWLNTKMEDEYQKGMKWKRELHKTENNKYFESYSYYNSEGVLLEKLKENLIKFHVSLKPKNKSQVLRELVENDRYFYNEFKNLIVTFINQYKVNNFNSFNQLRDKANKNGKMSTRVSIFLSIIEPIFNKYEEELKKKNQIDFNDMINIASKLISNNQILLNYKYIIVDEYQDISHTRYKLIDSIRNQSNSKLIAVGDDWQSIYRFAGSDVTLINEFESNNHKQTNVKSLEMTYRNSQELLTIVGSFIMKNDTQRKKSLVSNKSLKNPIRISAYEDNKIDAIKDAVNLILSEFNNTKEILLLGRFSFDNMYIDNNQKIDIVKVLNKEFRNINFKFMTIHKSKGLEAEHVILVNAENSKLGFPSKITDDPIIELVLPKNEKFKYSEERRLFYVALTRTKNLIYIVVPKNNPSIFVKELVNEGFVPNFLSESSIVCPKCGGTMTIKDSKNYYCQNYPLCDHMVTIDADLNTKCPNCGDYLVLKNGKYGSFYGCNSYRFTNNPIKSSCNYTSQEKPINH